MDEQNRLTRRTFFGGAALTGISVALADPNGASAAVGKAERQARRAERRARRAANKAPKEPAQTLFRTVRGRAAMKLAAELKSYDASAAAIDGSLKRLGLDVIDLMIIHSPQPWMQFGKEDRFFAGNREAWRALEDALEAGKLRAIGVSNFQRVDLDNILESCRVRPMVNQVLAHISNTPTALIEYTQSQGILVEAYSPIAHGELMKNDTVAEMARRYGVSVPQLSIRYDLQLGLLPLPKTANAAHMKDNAAVDFVIADQDMQVLQTLPQIESYGEASVIPVFGGSLS